MPNKQHPQEGNELKTCSICGEKEGILGPHLHLDKLQTMSKQTNTPQKECCKKCDEYFPHRIGSHSDDFGGESDYPCYCNQGKCRNADCPCHTLQEWEREFDEEIGALKVGAVFNTLRDEYNYPKIKAFCAKVEQTAIERIKKKSERAVTLYMQALEGEKLSEKTWKKIARVNQLMLDI